MPHCDIVVLVRHPDRPYVLTQSDATARLPATGIDVAYEVPEVLAAVERMLGSLPPVLRIGQYRSDSEDDPTLVVLDLEAFGPVAPSGFEWADWSDLDVDALLPVELRDPLGRWIDRRESGPTAEDPPWARPGWFARASRWMEARLVEAGMCVTGPPVVVYTWGISMILRAETTTGGAYLKCSSPLFSREAAVTAALADRDPDLVTRVIAVEPDENWLLMHDHGNVALSDSPASEWALGLEVLAHVQQSWLPAIDQLARVGAEVRSLGDLIEAIPSFGSREPLASELSESEREEWDVAVPQFVAACERLRQLGPPPTVSHGDLHPGNVAITPDGPRIFDWSDTAIAHPFLDLALFTARADDLADRRSMRDVYLARWAGQSLPGNLAEAADLAIVVGTLYQVESYLRILTGLDPDDRGGLTGAARSWALRAIDSLRDGIAVRHRDEIID